MKLDGSTTIDAGNTGATNIVSSTVLANTVATQILARNIGKSALLLTAFMLLQKILALVQQVLIARTVGLSAQTDAFYIAQIVPMLAGAWILVSLTTTLVPRLRSSDPSHLMGLVLNITVILALISLALIAFADIVISVLGPGLSPAASRISIQLLREMSVLIVLMGLTGVLNALYYSRSQFIVPSIAACLLYLGSIAGAFLTPWIGVDAFAWGLVGGAIAQVAMLVLFSGRKKLPAPLFRRKELAGFSRSFLSISIVSAVGVLCLIVDRVFASSGSPGMVTAVTFASNLMTIPSSMIVMGLISALFPSLVILREDRKAVAVLLRKALGHVVFFFGPANLILFLGSDLIIRIVFHAAKFDANSVLMTSALLAAYSVGIFGTAIKDVFSSVLIALGRESFAVAGAIVSLGISITLKAMYLNRENPVWIAYSTSIAMWIGAVLLIVTVSMLVTVDWRKFWAEDGWRLAVLNCGFAGLLLILRRYIHSDTIPASLAMLFGSLLFYLAGAWMLGISMKSLRIPAQNSYGPQ